MRPWLPLLLLAGSLPAIADDPPSPSAPPDPDDAAYAAIERFVGALETARARHPDVGRLAYDRLIDHAIGGMLSSLDRHSSFLHPGAAGGAGGTEELEFPVMIEELGITIDSTGSGWQLAAVEEAGPASRAGARTNEILLAIGEIDARSQQTPALLELLRGPAGSKLTLKLTTEGKAPRSVTITRRSRDDRAVPESRLLEGVEPVTGYLRLAQFTSQAPREMEAALDELEDKGMKRLVLDLRGNPGGSLAATVKILGLFLPPETAVVTTRGRGPEKQNPTLATPEKQRRKRDYPIAVLIDRHSASASELTAGALQDLERAPIIGETSYGKGSVQQILPLGNGTAMRLTVATYHTPSGNTPHGTGITPDHPVECGDTDRRLISISRHQESATPEQLAELESWTDPVIQAALERTK
jgi:carboxyl-terminal processing protease